MANPASILVVDDNADDLKLACGLLAQDGFAVRSTPSGTEACDLVRREAYDIVLTDIVMPGVSGFEVIRNTLKARPETICIAVTSYGSLDSALDALSLGAYHYLVKPWDPADFRHCVRRGLEKAQLTRDLRQRNQDLERLNRELDGRVQDATRALQQLNQRVLAQMAELQELDNLKTAFLDTVTHDLRNPLTTILGALIILRGFIESGQTQEAAVCIQAARHATDHMISLVEQLLDAARLRSGKLALSLSPVPVSALIEETVAVARGIADAKRIRLDAGCDGDAALSVRADHGRLLQVLNNLTGNACKFTPDGGTVTLRAAAKDAFVHFTVADSGPGIDPKHHERIFDRFYQMNTSASKPSSGLGLGLSIARELVDLHGGKIWVESLPGQGSRFHFTVPR